MVATLNKGGREGIVIMLQLAATLKLLIYKLSELVYTLTYDLHGAHQGIDFSVLLFVSKATTTPKVKGEYKGRFTPWIMKSDHGRWPFSMVRLDGPTSMVWFS
jgi:hypothetical protein